MNRVAAFNFWGAPAQGGGTDVGMPICDEIDFGNLES
jgi:hypothetical protein